MRINEDGTSEFSPKETAVVAGLMLWAAQHGLLNRDALMNADKQLGVAIEVLKEYGPIAHDIAQQDTTLFMTDESKSSQSN